MFRMLSVKRCVLERIEGEERRHMSGEAVPGTGGSQEGPPSPERTGDLGMATWLVMVEEED